MKLSFMYKTEDAFKHVVTLSGYTMQAEVWMPLFTPMDPPSPYIQAIELKVVVLNNEPCSQCDCKGSDPRFGFTKNLQSNERMYEQK